MINEHHKEVVDTATTLFNNNLTPLPCNYNAKKPANSGWGETTYKNVEAVTAEFSKRDCNLGILLDDKTVAIDLDALNIANKIGVAILGRCGIGIDRNILGRDKKPCGKIILKSNSSSNYVRHKVSDEQGKTIIELLGHKHNVIMPPSVVDDDDQFKYWNEFYPEMNYHAEAEIITAMNMVALWSMLDENYPTGDRDNAIRCLVTLFKASDLDFIDADFVNFFTDSLARTNNDDERVNKNWAKFYEKTVKTKKPLDVLKKGFGTLPDYVQKYLVDALRINERKALKISTLQDVMEMTFDKPKFLVKDMFPVGLACIAGRPKNGKTRFTHWLAEQFASGNNVWGRETLTGSSFFLSLEDTQEDWHIRSNQMGIDKIDNRNIQFVTMEHWDGSTFGKGVEEHIEDWIASQDNPQMIVIDTYVKVSAYKKGKDMYAEQSKELGRIHKIAKMNQVLILLIHHTTKADYEDAFDEISGSTALQGICDMIMVFQRKRGTGDMNTVIKMTGRRITEQLHTIAPNDSNEWEYLGEGDDQSKISLPTMEKNILQSIGTITDLFAVDTGVKVKDILDHLKITDPKVPVKYLKGKHRQAYDNYSKKCRRMVASASLYVGDDKGSYRLPPF